MVQAEGARRHPIKSGGWWSRLKLLPFTVVLCSLTALAVMCAWSNYAVQASKSTSKMLDSLAVEGGLVEWVEAYAAWVSVSIIGAIAATALAIFLGWWKLQLSGSKLLKSGPLQGKSWKRFGWVTCSELALLLLLMAFLAAFSGFCCAWLLGASVLQGGAEYATRAFELIGQRIEALGVGTLSAEEVGEVFADVAADSVSRAAAAPEAVAALQLQLLEDSGAANDTDLLAGLEQDLQDAFVYLRGAATGLCPSSICLNLALYGFLDSKRCVCSMETVDMVRRRSSSIIDDVAVALSLAVIAFIAFGILVGKLSRDQKGVLKDWHWIREMNLKAPRSFPKDNPVNDSAQRSPQETLEAGAPTLSAWGKPDTAPNPGSSLPSAPPGQPNAWTSAW